MSKTITLRIDDDIYTLLKTAANGEKRTISNFIEYAAVNYLSLSSYVSDSEMIIIENDESLKKEINKGLKDISTGKFKIVQ
ncbi:MAG: hypothetical protein L3J41_03270 [Melioribacteraceae bacterium]|nr:hypothetical protein [Melioribacteraceae bacterium]